MLDDLCAGMNEHFMDLGYHTKVFDRDPTTDSTCPAIMIYDFYDNVVGPFIASIDFREKFVRVYYKTPHPILDYEYCDPAFPENIYKEIKNEHERFRGHD
jgi:hypothetical protein